MVPVKPLNVQSPVIETSQQKSVCSHLFSTTSTRSVKFDPVALSSAPFVSPLPCLHFHVYKTHIYLDVQTPPLLTPTDSRTNPNAILQMLCLHKEFVFLILSLDWIHFPFLTLPPENSLISSHSAAADHMVLSNAYTLSEEGNKCFHPWPLCVS